MLWLHSVCTCTPRNCTYKHVHVYTWPTHAHNTCTYSYDVVFSKVEIVAAAPGKCSCELTLTEFHLNRGGSLHGGFTATLVDGVSTIAVMCAEKPPGVSVDMSIT